MIILHIDPSEMRSSGASQVMQALVAEDATTGDLRAPARGAASDPVEQWLVGEEELDGVSSPRPNIELPDLEWTAERERQFAGLAGREAMGVLSRKEKLELERLAGLRRGMKNPRAGQDLLLEYEQRKVTRDLIKALDRYVKFHKAAGYAEQTER